MIRVTSLLRWAGVTTPIPETQTTWTAMKRGSDVHEWSVKIERDWFAVAQSGGDVILTMPHHLRGYGRAVVSFAQDYKPQWTAIESRIDDPAIDLTGCPDRVGIIDDAHVIVDYKTGGRYDWHRLQLALYAVLVERSRGWRDDFMADTIQKRLSVYLLPDGKYRLVSHSGRSDILEAWKLITRYRKSQEVTHVS